MSSNVHRSFLSRSKGAGRNQLGSLGPLAAYPGFDRAVALALEGRDFESHEVAKVQSTASFAKVLQPKHKVIFV